MMIKHIQNVVLIICFSASSYVVRVSKSIAELRTSFENATKLGDDDVISGNLGSPNIPSEKETFVIRFPVSADEMTLFLGVKVNHSEGRMSDVSNVVSAAVVYVPPVKTGGLSEQALLAIKITFGILVPVAVIVAGAFIAKAVYGRKMRKTKQEPVITYKKSVA